MDRKKNKSTLPGYDAQYGDLRKKAIELRGVLCKKHTVSIYFDFPKKKPNQLKVVYWDTTPPKSFFTQFKPKIYVDSNGIVSYIINNN